MAFWENFIACDVILVGRGGEEERRTGGDQGLVKCDGMRSA